MSISNYQDVLLVSYLALMILKIKIPCFLCFTGFLKDLSSNKYLNLNSIPYLSLGSARYYIKASSVSGVTSVIPL